ncbi:MAG: hypothetical protein JO307_17465 [Bryobacterales bacterium]|nr:hypothetical protein [Bryobacterales bacterium]MBV9400790.1 hypothetical protein [Bryobacterales bacterium]
MKGVVIHNADPNFTKCTQNYRGQFLDAARLMQFSGDSANELPEQFLRDALSHGDECYGFLHGEALAAYGWYSNRPTPIEVPELTLHFDQQYIYMYKGFTHVNHRGQRLHAVGMTRALEAYLARGYKGMVAYVEWNNFASLRSCDRMGFKEFGTIVVTKLFGRYIVHCTDGCGRLGFRLEAPGGKSARRPVDGGAPAGQSIGS